MPTPREARYLQPDEEVLHEERRHPLSVLDDVLLATIVVALLIAGILLFFPPMFREDWVRFAVPWFIVLPAVWIVYVFVRYRIVITSRYIITKERVYASHGRLRFTLLQTTYDKMTDLHVRQSFFGRYWNFGTVRVQTSGVGVRLAGIRDPFAIKRAVETARSKFIERLVEEHKARRPKGAAKAAAEPAAAGLQVLWRGKMAPESLLGPLIGLSLTFLVGTALLSTGLAVASAKPAILPGAVMLFFSLLSLFGLITRYRYTSFEITSDGLVVSSGWLSRNRVETTYDKITDVTTNQSLLGRLMNYGRISANTAGGLAAPILFQGVRGPQDIKALIEEARQRRRTRAGRA